MATAKKPAATKPVAKRGGHQPSGGPAPAKPPKKTRNTENFTSFYLDPESRARLDEMAAEVGESRSYVVRSLIQGADSKRNASLTRIANELMRLAGG